MTGFAGRRVLAIAAAFLGLCPGGRAAPDSTEVELAKVPAQVMAAANKEVKGAKWAKATRHEEGKDVSYEIEGKDARQRSVWVTVAADGTVEEVRTEVAFNELPAAARKAVAAAVPKFTPAEVYEVREGTDVSYDLEGKDARKRSVWLTVSAAGEVDEVSTEVTAKEVPAVAQKAVQAKFPRFKASAYYEVRQDGKVIRYDIEGKRPRDKEDITVSVSPDGKSVEIDE